jgi:hypothetical protein
MILNMLSKHQLESFNLKVFQMIIIFLYFHEYEFDNLEANTIQYKNKAHLKFSW